MADNFGPGQPRVLSVSDRSLDQVVFQQARPPLTSEWNLINQIGDFKSQQGVQTSLPSGWIKVGAVEDTGTDVPTAEAAARSGQVLTSLTYGADQFKFICKDATNIAVVNGWPIILTPTASSFITLPPESVTSTYRYDIVFLEVWKKLVSFGDPIYPYGNTQAVALPDNEILWNVLGAETTKRVQLQYRIRTYPSSSYQGLWWDTSAYPEGLGSASILAVGGNPDGAYTSHSFVNAGEKDIGLYIAGDGSPASQTDLNTVDGYVYAIPMLMIYRRGYTPSTIFSSNKIFNSSVLFNVTTASDRPDGKYADMVYEDDIVDLRHQIVTSGKDLDGIFQESFRKLTTNQLSTCLGKGFSNRSGVKESSSVGGSTLFKLEQINGSTNNIGYGCASSDFKRRTYCNAEIIEDHNIIEILPPNGGSYWDYTNNPGRHPIWVTPLLNTTIGEVVSIDGLYYKDTNQHQVGPSDFEYSGNINNWGQIDDPINGIGITITPTTYSTINPGNSSSSCHIYVEFTFKYYAQPDGFLDVPKKFYEISKNVYQPVATRDQTVPVRFNGSALIAGTLKDYVKYQGGNYTDNYAFGHEYYYYISGQASPSFSVPSVLNNYPILGVKTVQIGSGGVYGNPESFSLTRNPISGIYTVGISDSLPIDVLVTLYTGSGPTEPDSFRFFELSKQGRGIIDIYEMILVEADQDIHGPAGQYILDTVDKPIIAIGTYTSYSSYTTGTAFAYDGTTGSRLDVSIVPHSSAVPLTQVNSYLPVLSGTSYDDGLLPTRLWLTASTVNASIIVPVLVHSYVTASETTYSFYYNFNPYQGILTSSNTGKIEKEGPAIVTSEGSGIIDNFTIAPSASDSAASVTQAMRTVTQSGENTLTWATYTKPGDYFNVVGSPYFYRILSVDSDTQLTLAELFVEASITAQAYSIVRLDTPNNNISNIIDRMPSYDATDYNGMCSSFSMASGGVTGTIHEIYEKTALQDPLDTIVNDFQLGANPPPVNRGRTFFRLSDGKNDFFKLGVLTPYIKYGSIASWDPKQGYKKVYQSYLYNEAYYDGSNYRDLTGRVYLLVVSSETNQGNPEILLNGFSNNDAVDIFELVGRPIIKTL